MRATGRHFLQIPGPSAVPERVLNRIAMPVTDHRGPDFGALGLRALEGLQWVFQSTSPVVIYPASGTGAWEAALVNTLSPGDQALMVETGHFASLWRRLADRYAIQTELLDTDWRRGADPDQIEQRLRQDTAQAVKAVCVVHNETSTGCTSRIAEIRQAIDAARHPALLLVDTISGLASADLKFDQWGIDVAIAGSQKGLMLPPGLSFNALSPRALTASAQASLPRAYWNWQEMLAANERGYFPYTPATNLLYGLIESIAMLQEEGLENVFARHHRHAQATRLAVEAWGLEVQCTDPREYSPVLTAVRVPEGYDADQLRAVILKSSNVSLGNGLSRLQGRVFRIGHLGDFNDPMLLGTLGAIEIGLHQCGIPHHTGGVQIAIDYLKNTRAAAA